MIYFSWVCLVYHMDYTEDCVYFYTYTLPRLLIHESWELRVGKLSKVPILLVKYT